jgi:3-deoxy-7-phosphoheptulonate synthase
MIWQPESWKSCPISQQPEYKDSKHLNAVTQKLRGLPPLVSVPQIQQLSRHLAQVARGNAFLLQGGDCAESFAEFNQNNLLSFFRVMLQMAVTLVHGVGRPIVKVGRIAGQFAKPRSQDTEKQGDVELPAYRGDMVNQMDFSADGRRADPTRLLDAYYQSASTLNYLRALAVEGYASLGNVRQWNSEFIAQCQESQHFEAIVERIHESISFVEACGLPLNQLQQLHGTDFFTSHEALILHYEEALVRLDEQTERAYDCSAHMLWIGDRTRDPKGAHVEFARGIANPIGLKVGPSTKIDDLLKLISILNPYNISGKLTLISRMGEGKIEDLLPPIIQAVTREGNQVIWSCDPMHGNTVRSGNGIKTRKFEDVLSEVHKFFRIHRALGSYAGGIHIEMTGQDVTECTGGSQAISDHDLHSRYHTHCDPRLNALQSLELAFLVADELKG